MVEQASSVESVPDRFHQRLSTTKPRECLGRRRVYTQVREGLHKFLEQSIETRRVHAHGSLSPTRTGSGPSEGPGPCTSARQSRLFIVSAAWSKLITPTTMARAIANSSRRWQGVSRRKSSPSLGNAPILGRRLMI